MDSFNIARKIFHSSSLVPVILYYLEIFDGHEWQIFEHNTRSISLYFLILIVLTMLTVDLLRFKFEPVQKLFLKYVGFMLKGHETDRFQGGIPYFLGLTIGVILFPKVIVVAAVFFLQAGDPAAAYFGGKYGKHRFSNGKSMEGLIAGIAVAFPASLFFLTLHTMYGVDPTFTLWDANSIHYGVFAILFAGAVVGFTAELFSKNGILSDDNFIIPVVSGAVMTILWFIYRDIPFHLMLPDWKALFLPI
ncbi:MAG: hypothetical protein ABUK01_06455 [Leptospirales bacterium]